ncbi:MULTISPECIES: hypothetical protein [Streptomyces]|uniref:Uncharacterized protein n=2 Tax=Streptomyces TaxID=1883 RepID=A0A5N6AJA6_9ACTN|nr:MULTISPECIES: hypothetical protein [Streptomyces]KAB8167960.1 hypothetical protein FH607_008290 [Streptomyces mimosae]KAB8177393.1 hypothetical protein FH609_009130 [Streptomyces sp. 3MP-14]RMI31993.1 hypothetical protein EBN88_25530 [Streptomyces triticirhizae]
MFLTKSDIWRRVAGLLVCALDVDEPCTVDADFISVLLDDLTAIAATPDHPVTALAEERITHLIGAFTAAFMFLAEVHDGTDPETPSLEAARTLALTWAEMDV